MGPLPDAALVARRSAPRRLAVLASPAYLARRGAPARPRDLADHDCIVYTVPGGDVWRFREGGRSTSVRVAGRFRSDSAEAMRAAAVGGHGIAGLPTYMLGTAIADGTLVPLLTAYPVAEAGLYAVRPPVAERNVQPQPGVCVHEVGNHRREMGRAEGDRRGDAQQSTQLLLAAPRVEQRAV